MSSAEPGLEEIPPTAEAADDALSDVKPTGTLVGPYRIIGLLGEGGMGRVYAAEHKILGRKVALKMLRREYAQNASAVGRFFAEARAVNQIAHPNIIDITDFVEARGPHGENFYVMELLQGTALKDVLAEGPLALARSLRIAVQVADAIGAVHQSGIVHRDLKPANVFLTTRSGDSDYVKLLDFGVAKLAAGQMKDLASTATGAIVGTPQYMSPEQLNGEHVDQSSDVYAFGLLLYELVTGRRAFEGKGLGDLAVKHLTARPKPPSKIRDLPYQVPAALEALILECLGKKPAERPAGMAVVEDRLRAIAAAEGVALEGSGPLTAPAWKPPRRPLPAWGVAAAGACLAFLGGGWLAWQGSEDLAELKADLPAPPPGRQAGGQPGAEDTPAEPPEAPPAPAPAPPDTINLVLSSEPPGAAVRREEGGATLGRTPLEMPIAYGPHPIVLVFELDGYLPLTEIVRPEEDVQLKVVLSPAARRPKRRVLKKTDVADPYQ